MPIDTGNLRWVDETGSTNADVLELAREGAPEGVVVVADHQTAGRGRLGRSWQAPPGSSLLVTVLLRPPSGAVETVTMAAALAMAEAVEGETDGAVRPLLKWPNDLCVEERKLAGVLAETDWHTDGAVAIAVGIGVNCNWPPVDEWPEELRSTMASINHLAGAAVDRRSLLERYVARLSDRYGADRAALVADWRTRSATLGREVRIEAGGHVVEGIAVDVTDAGHLVVDGNGSQRIFAVGDVTHLRHATPPR